MLIYDTNNNILPSQASSYKSLRNREQSAIQSKVVKHRNDYDGENDGVQISKVNLRLEK